MSGVFDVGLDPADVLAASEPPLSETLAALVEAVRGAAPEEHERTVSGHLVQLQTHDLRQTERGG